MFCSLLTLNKRTNPCTVGWPNTYFIICPATLAAISMQAMMSSVLKIDLIEKTKRIFLTKI